MSFASIASVAMSELAIDSAVEARLTMGVAIWRASQAIHMESPTRRHKETMPILEIVTRAEACASRVSAMASAIRFLSRAVFAASVSLEPSVQAHHGPQVVGYGRSHLSADDPGRVVSRQNEILFEVVSDSFELGFGDARDGRSLRETGDERAAKSIRLGQAVQVARADGALEPALHREETGLEES